jgi:hypothetical protein
MRLWRRDEPLHVKLAREGGLSDEGGHSDEEPPPHDVRPRWGEPGIHGIYRPREWDATVVVDAPDVEGSSAAFVGLPDGSVIVEEGSGELTTLAEAIGRQVAAPYRAIAVRRDHGQWGVAAQSIRTIELPEQAGEELQLVVSGGERSLVVDGAPTFPALSELDRLLEGDGVVRARRLQGTLWEAEVSPL